MGTGASNGGRRSHCRKKSRSLHAREDSCSGAAADLICHGDATDTFHSQTPISPWRPRDASTASCAPKAQPAYALWCRDAHILPSTGEYRPGHKGAEELTKLNAFERLALLDLGLQLPSSMLAH